MIHFIILVILTVNFVYSMEQAVMPEKLASGHNDFGGNKKTFAVVLWVVPKIWCWHPFWLPECL
jgi:hypothetical protein